VSAPPSLILSRGDTRACYQPAAMLHINELTYRIAGRMLIDRATVAVSARQKVALVGRNGSGKTTLLKLIAGELQPDGGAISVPPRWRIGRVAQDAPAGPEALIDIVLAADTERTQLLRTAEMTTDPHEIAETHERLAQIQAHAAPARAAAILAGLGFDAAAQARPASDFSGGWRMRVALAAILFAEPDLLLLDEPTNHLDLEATLWLESYLKTYPRTVLLVSHDRDLLNAVPDRVIHIDRGKLISYSGNYDSFERVRRERLKNTVAVAAKQAEQRRHMQAFIDRFRYKASKARQAQSRIKALARMEPVAPVIEEASIEFRFPDPEPLSPPILTLDSVTAGYGERPVLSRLDLRIDMDDRIALLGANGNGKSTLVRLIAGRLKPMAGTLRRSPKLRIGYFAQHQAEELNLAATPLRHMQELEPLATDEKLRAHLGRFGFSGQKALTQVGALSGGEKARLLFALMSRTAPHLLLLDEPTNHLDMDSREALVEALNAYEGAVILISHDPHLIELTADRLWRVAEGTCHSFEGDLDDYRRLLLDERRGAGADTRTAEPSTPDGPTRKEMRRQSAAARAALAPLRQEIRGLEVRIADLSREREALERRLGDPATYVGNGSGSIVDLQTRLAEVTRQLAQTEEAWLERHDELERASPSPDAG
jgi:ATP-binding cassette, subfamily F, member 3